MNNLGLIQRPSEVSGGSFHLLQELWLKHPFVGSDWSL